MSLVKNQFSFIVSLLALSFTFLNLELAWSTTIKQVKGKKALIDIDSTAISVGEDFFTVDAAGKKKAIIKIKQVKGKKAIADILKGKPEAGHTLTPRIAPTRSQTKTTARSSKTKTSSSSQGSSSSISNINSGWGVMGNVYMNSMSAKFLASGNRQLSVDLKGTSFGVTGLYDYRMSSKFSVRGLVGYDMYQLSGSTPLSDCTNSTTCTVSISYLSSYGIARYNITEDPTRIWVGGGLGFLLALSKTSTILNTDQISTNLVYMISGGADIKMSNNSFLPLQLDYAMFQGSDSVRANSIIIRAGWGFYF